MIVEGPVAGQFVEEIDTLADLVVIDRLLETRVRVETGHRIAHRNERQDPDRGWRECEQMG